MKRLVFTALLSVCLAGAAAAQGPDLAAEARAIPVQYADLDLSSARDADALLSRLRYAALRACGGDQIDRAGPATRRAIESCREQAVERAVAQLDEPALSERYAAQR